MYEAFFGLSVRPFADRPDPDFFAESEPHMAALRALYEGLEALQPLFVITGETGCGKTMLAQLMLHGLAETTTVGLITNPHTSVRDLTRWVLLSFGQETVARTDAELREALALFLVSEYGAGRRCLLVVDEAQNLTAEALAGLHGYLDLNSEEDCLLQIVLVAGARLLQTMRDPRLAPWAARLPQISLVGPLAPDEASRYVRSRLATGGAQREIFTDRAIAAIGLASGGVPRLINAICDTALAQAFAQGHDTIDRDLIADVIAQGQAAGFGSLAMLAPVEMAQMPPPVEPAPASGSSAGNDIARFVESRIAAAAEPDLSMTPPRAAPEPDPVEFFPMEPVEFFQTGHEERFPAAFIPPEPDAEQPAPVHVESPAPDYAPPAPLAPPPVTSGWPSISRNSRLARLGREGSINPRSATGGASLRRRFLPRA